MLKNYFFVELEHATPHNFTRIKWCMEAASSSGAARGALLLDKDVPYSLVSVRKVTRREAEASLLNIRRVPYSEQLIAEQSNLDMFGTVMELDIVQDSVVAHDREKTQQIIEALQEKINDEQEEDACRPGI